MVQPGYSLRARSAVVEKTTWHMDEVTEGDAKQLVETAPGGAH